jgi:uncharacterized membrane protein YozB (DUF420 family)
MVEANFTVFYFVKNSSGNAVTMNRTVVIVPEASSSEASLSPMTAVIVAAAAFISLAIVIVVFVMRRQRKRKRALHIAASTPGSEFDFLILF